MIKQIAAEKMNGKSLLEDYFFSIKNVGCICNV